MDGGDAFKFLLTCYSNVAISKSFQYEIFSEFFRIGANFYLNSTDQIQIIW